jgi:hypothetical protein
MLVEETVTYLEMTAPDQLRPGRPAPAPVEMDKLDRASWPLLKSTYERIAAPLNWQGRRARPDAWPDEKWEELLAHSSVHAWIARVGGEVTGLVELVVQPGGDVEIAVFGLVPEFGARGLVPTSSRWPRCWPGTPSQLMVFLFAASGCIPPRAITHTPSPTTNVAGSAHSEPSDGSARS